MSAAANPGVVVGHDGSVQAQVAVRWAAAEAVRRERPLTVVHVVDAAGLAMEAMVPYVEDWPKLAVDVGRATADEGVALARRAAPTVDARAVVERGAPAEVLVEKSRRAELIAVGTRGRGHFAAVCLGSVSTAMTAHSFCPVVIVRGDSPRIPGPEFPVVVGVDGSPSSHHAVDVAAEVAAQAQAPLRVVSVWSGLPEDSRMAGYASGMSPSADRFAEAARAAAEHVADQAANTARQAHPDLDVGTAVVEGYPAHALMAAAGGAGLLVVGTRGRGAFTGLVLGSVSHGVVHGARCPVMIIRTPKVPQPHHHESAAAVHVMI